MCALFYDYNVQISANHRHVCSTWAETDPILAVALENREVHFFTDEVRAGARVVWAEGLERTQLNHLVMTF